jgi:hypothetical protein
MEEGDFEDNADDNPTGYSLRKRNR